MPSDCISFQNSGYFSSLINDYLDQKPNVQPLYHRFPTLENFGPQIEEKKANFDDSKRAILVAVLEAQYAKINASTATLNNIKLLNHSNTYTITTGHQLNLFSGPLYFLYKIISTINLTKELQQQYPEQNFVPVYWMATEDHDFEEINYFTFKGKKFCWNRESSGPVGRLSTEGLEDFLTIFALELGSSTNAEKLKTLFHEAYLKHTNLADATRYLANALFGDYGLDVECKDGVVDLNDLSSKMDVNCAALFIQHPNYFGCLEDVQDLSQIAHASGAKLVQYTNPMTLGYLKSPRANGVDIAIGEAQPLGIPMSYGGPFLGFMATSSDLVRRLPGRIAGQTLDENGKRAFALTLQAREQHIRREKASSSICSNQALMALVASMYLASVGPSGLKEVAEYGMRKAHYFASELVKLGFKLKYNSPFFHEFVTVGPIENSVIERALDEINVLSGLSLSSHETLWCCTETTKKEDIDRVISRLKEVLS